MNLTGLSAEIAREVAIIWNAPWLYAASILIVAALIWRIRGWEYDARIKRLRQDIESEKRENDRLRVRGAGPSNAASPLATEPDRAEPARARQIRILRDASLHAGRNKAESLGRATGRHAPEIRAALLTAAQAFGLSVPAETGSARTDEANGKAFLDRVLPYLEQGHDEQARAQADRFIGDLPKI